MILSHTEGVLRLLLLTVLASCTHAQSSFAMNAGEAMALGGVAGIVGSIAAQPLTSSDLRPVTDVFCVTSAVGIVMYAIVELSQPEFQERGGESPEQALRREHRWARTWTERAQIAARLKKCERVRLIEPKVLRLDPELHDLVLMQDPDVLACLQSAGSAP